MSVKQKMSLLKTQGTRCRNKYYTHGCGRKDVKNNFCVVSQNFFHDPIHHSNKYKCPKQTAGSRIKLSKKPVNRGNSNR